MKARDDLIKQLIGYKSKYATNYDCITTLKQLIAILQEQEEEERNSD